MIDRRTFLTGLVAGAAGLLVPERKVWALDSTMISGTLPDHLRKIEWQPWMGRIYNDQWITILGPAPAELPEADYNFFQQWYVRGEMIGSDEEWVRI